MKEILKGVTILLGVLVIGCCMALMLYTAKKEPPAPQEITVIASPPKEVPVFKLSVLEVSWHDVRILEENKAWNVFGKDIAQIGKTTLIYQYDVKVTLGVPNIIFPEQNENKLTVTMPEIVITSCEISNIDYVVCSSSGWASNTVQFTHLFKDINENQARAAQIVFTPDRIESAKKNYREQVSAFYNALGYEVEFKTY